MQSHLVWQYHVQAPVHSHDFQDGFAQQQWPQLKRPAANQQGAACKGDVTQCAHNRLYMQTLSATRDTAAYKEATVAAATAACCADAGPWHGQLYHGLWG